jgi:hypothetical protein
LNDDSRAKIEIHPKRGLKMDIVTDKWLRGCVGIAVLVVSLSVLVLALAPLLYVIRWW